MRWSNIPNLTVYLNVYNMFSVIMIWVQQNTIGFNLAHQMILMQKKSQVKRQNYDNVYAVFAR